MKSVRLSQISHYFPFLMTMFPHKTTIWVTWDISSSSENISYPARVSRLSFRFLWLWFTSTKHTVCIKLQMLSKCTLQSHHFVTRDISSSSENINNPARVSRLCFRFLWLWFTSAKHTVCIKLRMLRKCTLTPVFKSITV